MILFGVVCGALLLVVLLATGLPLLVRGRVPPERDQYDRAVYRDQLREVDRDLARGVLTEVEAGAARLEIQRRLLAVNAGGGWGARGPSRSPVLAAVVCLFVVIGAGGLYWRLGAPTLDDAPYAARPPAEAAAENAGTAPPVDMKAAAAQLEAKLRADPSNAEGWELYARTQAILGDWGKATDAYRHTIELGRKTPETYAGYGEMLVLAAGGIVPPAAHDAFVAAHDADPRNDVARFYLAVADAQAGEAHKAVDAWLALAADMPDDSPMRGEIARRIADAARTGGFDAPPLPKGTVPAAAAGPTPEQMQAAAAEMPQAERDKMINGMVAQLASRLAANPNDLEGWLRLGRAYAVLGDAGKAADAYDHAISLKPGDPDIKLQAVGALLGRLQPKDALPPRAVTLLQAAAAQAPEAPEVLWYLGIVAAREGHPDEARQHWTRLIAKLPEGGEDRKMVQAALAALKGS